MARQIATHKILKGTEGPGSIGEFLGVSRGTVYKYIKIGMPVELIFGAYHAHTDNIEEWFKRVTRKQYQNPPAEDVNDILSA